MQKDHSMIGVNVIIAQRNRMLHMLQGKKNVCKQCKHVQLDPPNARHHDQVAGQQEANFRCRLYITPAVNYCQLSSITTKNYIAGNIVLIEKLHSPLICNNKYFH